MPIPRLTVHNFVKSHSSLPLDLNALDLFHQLANKFVKQVADMSNEYCQSKGRAIINRDHLEHILRSKCGLADRQQELDEVYELVQLEKKMRKERQRLILERLEEYRLEQEAIKAEEQRQQLTHHTSSQLPVVKEETSLPSFFYLQFTAQEANYPANQDYDWQAMAKD